MTESQRISNMTPRLLMVMGVSGSGKSTIALNLADAIDGIYLDGDDYHPKSNIEKMSKGVALTDDDRWPWLELFAKTMAKQNGKTKTIGACSSLTKAYREYLTKQAEEPILFIYLDGSKELILERMTSRANHFMPSSQLDNQFNTLEIPDSSELALHIDISGTSKKIISDLLSKLEIYGINPKKIGRKL